MNIQALKRWHWIVIGLLAGAILAGARMLATSDQMVGGPGFLDQVHFEYGLSRVGADGSPVISDIVIRPRLHVDLVRFRYFDLALGEPVTYLYAARRPYVRLGSVTPPNPQYRVADFLAEIAANNPKISFRYAWWDRPPVMVTIYALFGAALIGGIWPYLLRLMVGAGLGRPEPEYDLDRFKSEPQPQKQSELSEDERKHLEELEAQMAAGLAGESAEARNASGAASSAEIRALGSEEVAAVANNPADEKDFAGEYYPVEKKTPHGFTLVELLVVIGIVVLLVAILLPVLSQARARAQTANCASNLRQVGAGLEMYNQIYKHLPFDARPATLASAMDEMNVGHVMVCPSDPGGSPSYSLNAAFAGLPKSAGNPSDVMASETGFRHLGGPNILFFDGHVEERGQ